MLIVLAAANRGNVRGDSSVDDYVLLGSVLRDGNTADDLKAVTIMNLSGDTAKSRMERRKWKGFLVDVAERLVKGCYRSALDFCMDLVLDCKVVQLK